MPPAKQLAQAEDGGRDVTLAEISLTNPLAAAAAERRRSADAPGRAGGGGAGDAGHRLEELYRVAVSPAAIRGAPARRLRGRRADLRPLLQRTGLSTTLEGGALEALGRLLTRSVRIALYPEADPCTGLAGERPDHAAAARVPLICATTCSTIASFSRAERAACGRRRAAAHPSSPRSDP